MTKKFTSGSADWIVDFVVASLWNENVCYALLLCIYYVLVELGVPYKHIGLWFELKKCLWYLEKLVPKKLMVYVGSKTISNTYCEHWFNDYSKIPISHSLQISSTSVSLDPPDMLPLTSLLVIIAKLCL